MTEENKNLKEQIKKSVTKTGTASLDEGDRAGAVAQKTADLDPVLENELNQEPWWQSGVGVFGAGGALWAIGVILSQVGQHHFDFASYNFGMMVSAIGSLTGFIMVLYRRYWPGLGPMFNWWK